MALSGRSVEAKNFFSKMPASKLPNAKPYVIICKTYGLFIVQDYQYEAALKQLKERERFEMQDWPRKI